LTQFFRPN